MFFKPIGGFLICRFYSLSAVVEFALCRADRILPNQTVGFGWLVPIEPTNSREKEKEKKMTRFETVNALAEQFREAGYSLPERWREYRFTCSVAGCRPKAKTGGRQEGPFKAPLFIRERETGKLVLNQHHPRPDQSGNLRRPIPQWWVNVDKPFVVVPKGEEGEDEIRPAAVCRFHSNMERTRLRSAKVEELLLSGEAGSGSQKERETSAWKHEEVRGINPFVPLHEVFQRLETLERAESDSLAEAVLSRESELLTCSAPGCGHEAPARSMKALAVATSGEGRNRKQRFVLEYLLEEIEQAKPKATSAMQKIRDEYVTSHYEEVEYEYTSRQTGETCTAVRQVIAPAWLCPRCARNLYNTLMCVAGGKVAPLGRWALDCGGYTRPVYEPALAVIRRLERASLQRMERRDEAVRNAERRRRVTQEAAVKLGDVLGVDFAALEDEDEDEPTAEPTAEEAAFLTQRRQSQGRRPRKGGGNHQERERHEA